MKRPSAATIHDLCAYHIIDYYRGAHGIALVYDVTNDASFQNIRKWIQDVHTYAESNVNIVLIGNKCDLDSKRV
jgi:GTPase SAR1 family protein